MKWLIFKVLALLQVSLAIAAGDAPPCPELEEWLHLKARIPTAPEAVLERYALNEKEWQVRNAAAKQVYESYFAHRLNYEGMNRCLDKNEDRQNFLNTMQAVFLNESLAKLRHSSSVPIQAFVALVDARSSHGQTPLFRMTGRFYETSPAPFRAGFNRAVKSIYVDFGKVHPEEWNIILVHELLHSLDQTLEQAVHDYSQTSTAEKFSNLAHQGITVSQLTQADRNRFDAWLEAGLSRGLWAEYRAWVPTFLIYQEGLKENLWPKISWMEKVLAMKPSEMPLDRYIYNYLDAQSEDPTKGIFSLPLVRDELKILRRRYRTGDLLPEPGNLGAITR